MRAQKYLDSFRSARAMRMDVHAAPDESLARTEAIEPPKVWPRAFPAADKPGSFLVKLSFSNPTYMETAENVAHDAQ